MRRTNRRHVLALGTSAAVLVLLGAGSPKPSLFGRKGEPPLKVEETVGDLATVQSTGEVRVEGVGLVVGLDDTGSDPEPSIYRQKLLNKMRLANVPQAERWLADKGTSLVLVKGVIPMGISTEDVFDVELELTPASGTESLAGGILMKTELTQVGYVKGQELEGHVLATVYGPVMTGTTAQPNNPKVGRVLGGARVKKEIPYALVLKENRKSIRTSALLQSVVGMRFFYLDGVDQKGMAEAKTDQYLVLHVPRVYHQNQARFFQVLQLLSIVDTPELRARRLDEWGKELLDPKTSGVAALKLEGIGRNAVGILKKGLDSPDARVRFFSAEALAYLNDASGVSVLAEAAVSDPTFRAFALAALAATDQAASLLKLRELMANPDTQVRYGAFNALRSLDEHDVFLGKVRVLRDEPLAPADDDDGDAMALQIAAARARRHRRADPFTLYLVDCDGPPMVHVANSRRCEIVVFGKRQKLLTPVVLGGPGSVLINAALGDSQLQISRIDTDVLDHADQKVTAPLELGEMIREVANLGATYPEIVELLKSAEAQKNLEGPLVVDAVPAPVAEYEQAQLAGIAPDAKKDDAVGQAKFEPRPKRRSVLDRLRGLRRGR